MTLQVGLCPLLCCPAFSRYSGVNSFSGERYLKMDATLPLPPCPCVRVCMRVCVLRVMEELCPGIHDT